MPSIEERWSPRFNATRYFVRVRDPRTGKFTSRTFATRREAEIFQRDIADRKAGWALASLEQERTAEAETTLDEWAEEHFDTITKANAHTVLRYRRIYKARWSPHLGHKGLSRITEADVARALNAQAGSDKTILNVWAVLTAMLNRAYRQGRIPVSPALEVEPGRNSSHEEAEQRFLTREEFADVMHATPDYWKPLLWMLAGTGMRWGEMAALTVGDINAQAKTVRITKAEKTDPQNPSRRIVGPPKTKQSKRTITLPPETVAAVVPLLNRPRGERLFLPPRGGALRHRTFYVNIWQAKCLAEAGLDEPQPRLHDLRHSHVAWLIEAGVSLPVIQRRLGHSTIATTNDVYGHLLPDVVRAAAEAAEMVFMSPRELGG